MGKKLLLTCSAVDSQLNVCGTSPTKNRMVIIWHGNAWTAVFVLYRVFPRVRLDHLPPALASSLSQTKTSIVTNGRRSCSGSGIGQHGGYSHCLQSCWQVYCHPLSCCHVRSFVFQREYLEVIPGITCGTNGNVTLLTILPLLCSSCESVNWPTVVYIVRLLQE